MKALRDFALALAAGGFLMLAGCSTINGLSKVSVPTTVNGGIAVSYATIDSLAQEVVNAQHSGVITVAQEKALGQKLRQALESFRTFQHMNSLYVDSIAAGKANPNAQQKAADALKQAANLLTDVQAYLPAKGVKP